MFENGDAEGWPTTGKRSRLKMRTTIKNPQCRAWSHGDIVKACPGAKTPKDFEWFIGTFEAESHTCSEGGKDRGGLNGQVSA
jgi:hypothetical protein